MQKKKLPIRVTMEKDYAQFRLKNSDGSYTETSISSPVYECSGMDMYIEHFEVQKGIVLSIMKIPSEVDIYMDFEYIECPLSIGCALDCDYDMTFYKGDTFLKETTAQGPLFFISRTSNINGYSAKKPGCAIHGVSVSFDYKMAPMIFGNSLSYINDSYKPFFFSDEDFLLDMKPLSALLKATADSLLNCRYPAPQKEFFYKVKAFEILNYAFSEHLIENQKPKKSVLQPDEIDKILKAKEYINNRLESPPTIPELAKITGINDFKLKAGFKEMFGTTIYGYIHNEKMSKAKLMLETGNYSVSEIAWDIGYTNVSHFIKAFKKSYDVTPGQILYSVKSNITQFNVSKSS